MRRRASGLAATQVNVHRALSSWISAPRRTSRRCSSTRDPRAREVRRSRGGLPVGAEHLRAGASARRACGCARRMRTAAVRARARRARRRCACSTRWIIWPASCSSIISPPQARAHPPQAREGAARARREPCRPRRADAAARCAASYDACCASPSPARRSSRCRRCGRWPARRIRWSGCSPSLIVPPGAAAALQRQPGQAAGPGARPAGRAARRPRDAGAERAALEPLAARNCWWSWPMG